MILLPRYLPQQRWGYLLLLPVFLNKPPPLKSGEVDFTLLYVGQGLSAVVRTAEHLLVYDTGPKYLNYDTGKTVVNPFLHWLNVRSIDTLVVSHWDNDHSGGLSSIKNEFPIKTLYGSAEKNGVTLEYCVSGLHWQWDGVDFRFLYPTNMLLNLSNNSSCVLQIQTGQTRLLIPGDIEAFAEDVMFEKSINIESQLLIAPHHGSKTSSTARFIETVKPDLVLFPVGFMNRFKLPNEQVLTRYEDLGIKGIRTDKKGAIHVIMTPEGYQVG